MVSMHDVTVDCCSNLLFYKRRGKGNVLHWSTHAVALTMVDAIHPSPYTVCDSKSIMDY